MSDKLRKCVVTLPISPLEKPFVGLTIQPLLMDILASRIGFDSVLALNVNGSKFQTEDSGSHVSGYLKVIGMLGIDPIFVWLDSLESNKSLIAGFFLELLADGVIFKAEKELWKCPSGCFETLAEADNISLKRKTSASAQSGEICRICQEPIGRETKTAYLLRFPKAEIKSVFPEFYQKEIQEMSDRFRGSSLLISRTRKTVCLIPGEDNLYMDVDFFWSMYLSVLPSFGFSPEIVIGGNRSLFACYLVAAMADLINKKDILLVVPPYFKAPRGLILMGDEYLAENLIAVCPGALRLAVACSLNWQRKESILQLDMLGLFSKMAYRLEGIGRSNETWLEALSDLNGFTIKRAILSAKNSRRKFQLPELRGIV